MTQHRGKHHLQPVETYKGVPIYLYKDDRMGKDEWGASFEWYGRMQDAQVEDYERPTRANVIKAAKLVIDILKDVESQGIVGPDGYFKKE